ncbi:hypothetical protein QM588_17335 [Rhodococcus sp. IEGM 1354]|nr:hypothetical protein [Rhodococcus sp. IEGM 1354]MDI9932179.1 hypothetical protein [Rhodococcus sp. IEGM 1354]
MMSRASGPIDQPSAEMWWTTMAITCSRGPISNSRAWIGTLTVTSNVVDASAKTCR